MKELNSDNPLIDQFVGPLEAVGASVEELLLPPEHRDEARRWLKIALETGTANYDFPRGFLNA